MSSLLPELELGAVSTRESRFLQADRARLGPAQYNASQPDLTNKLDARNEIQVYLGAVTWKRSRLANELGKLNYLGSALVRKKDSVSC